MEINELQLAFPFLLSGKKNSLACWVIIQSIVHLQNLISLISSTCSLFYIHVCVLFILPMTFKPTNYGYFHLLYVFSIKIHIYFIKTVKILIFLQLFVFRKLFVAQIALSFRNKNLNLNGLFYNHYEIIRK